MDGVQLSHFLPPSRFEFGTTYWESSVLTTRIIGKTYSKCKCPAFTNIKQTSHYKVAIEKYNSRESFAVVLLTGFFSFGGQKSGRWSL